MEKADLLIVDDDRQITKSICRIFKKENWVIMSAQNVEDALKFISEIRFKVILSDIKMNGMNGFELLEQVHEIAPQTTRMVISGHSDVELILKLVNANGIDRYLVKPWEDKAMVLSVAKCIELYDLRMDLDRPESH